MGRFKGQTIQLSGPEKVLPTESSGIDLRDARTMNRPPREGGYEERPRRFERDERSFDDAPRRNFRERDDEQEPRRTFSKRSEEEPSRGDDEDCWRTGPARTTSGPVRRFESDSAPERRMPPRRSVEEDSTAADKEDDWRAGSAARPSAFVDRRASTRNDEDETVAPRRFGSRREIDAPPRVESRADEGDWRRGEKEPEAPSSFNRIERTRSTRPPTRAEEEGDWRTVSPAEKPSHSATPWARKASVQEAPERVVSRKSVEEDKPVRRAATPSTVQPKKEEDKWSSDEEEEEVVEEKPDMDKISKFAGKVEKLVLECSPADCAKKLDAVIRKVPVNFGRIELSSLEPMKAVLAIVLKPNLLSSESEVNRLVQAVAPLLVCLEELFVEHGGSSPEAYQLNVLEEVQKFVVPLQLPRLTPETSLVEKLWLSLYEQKVIAEEVFKLWLDNDTLDSPMKSTTMFQTEAFRAWLYDVELPGVQSTIRNGTADAGKEKDDWSDSDDSDIEALVPKRIAGVHLRPTNVASLRR